MRGVCVSLFSCSFHVCGSFSEAFPFRAGLPPPNLNYVLRGGAGSIGLASAKPQLCRRAVPAAELRECFAGLLARDCFGQASAKPQLCHLPWCPLKLRRGFSPAVYEVFSLSPIKTAFFRFGCTKTKKFLKNFIRRARGAEIGTVVHVIFTYDALFCFRESKRKC